MLKQCRFSSIKLRNHLNKIPIQNNNMIGKYGSKILYGINQPYSIMHNQTELQPLAELIDYVYTTLSLSNINVGPNFHLLQERYHIMPLESLLTINNDLNQLYNFKKNQEFVNLRNNNYSVLYYYNIDANLVLETTNGTYEPKESDLLIINNNYKHTIKKKIGTFDILRFKFY